MSDIEREFHETWLGMVQPIEGLVVSIPVLVDKECFERNPPALQYQLQALCSPANDNARKAEGEPSDHVIQDLPRFFEELLGLTPDLWDAAKGYRKGVKWAGVLPEAVSFYAPEGPQAIAPTLALRRQGAAAKVSEADGDVAQAASVYEMLVWELPGSVALDKPETVTGAWEYPPCAKFERLLRAARVPVGLVTNGHALRADSHNKPGGSGPGDRRDAPIRSSASRRAPPMSSPASRREASGPCGGKAVAWAGQDSRQA